MPLYGKGRKTATGKKPLENPLDRQKIQRVEGKRKLAPETKGWGDECTPLDLIDRKMRIIPLIKRALSNSPKPVIVDWGCGRGNAITEIAQSFPRTECYGYSNEFYRDWQGNDSVKFIHAPSGEMARYFKAGTIDIVYSHLGLSHVSEQLAEINRILPKIKKGGCIVLDVLSRNALKKLRKNKSIDVSEETYPGIESGSNAFGVKVINHCCDFLLFFWASPIWR